MVSKSGLAIMLSKLKGFFNPKLMAEQYETDSEKAADMIWFAYMLGDIEGKTIADFGCGPGIFGIGCLLLGAKKAYFVDNDADVMSILKENISAAKVQNAEVLNSDIKGFKEKVEVIMQNPPFGTKVKHADRAFLQKAFATASVVYSLHKASTANFVQAIARDNGFEITHRLQILLPLRASQPFHLKKLQRIECEWFRFAKL
jgi:putative methylase